MVELGALLQGRYRLIAQLGGGGMGRVYLAQDIRLAEKVCAVKQLIPDPHLSPEEQAQAAEQFQREAAILAHLSHPHLPVVYDAFEEAGFYYLVMDYIQGETLAARLSRNPEGLPVEQVLDWGLQLCEVLEYLHTQMPPIIFRDLKPDNIMVDAQGQVKLIDFGVARFFDPVKRTDTLKMGTAGYAPPEGYAGQGQTTPRSDIYSLGVTLHELLTGDDPTSHPFVFAPPHKLRDGVPPRLSDVLVKAVSLDPAARFVSAAAMRAALEKVTRPRGKMIPESKGYGLRETVLLPESTPAPARRSRARRLARGLGIAALVVVLLALLLSVGGAFLLSTLAERTIAAADWKLEETDPFTVTTGPELAGGIFAALKPYFPNSLGAVGVFFEDPDRAYLSIQLSGRRWELVAMFGQKQGIPWLRLERLNRMSLVGIGPVISRGINRGFEQVFAASRVRVRSIRSVRGILELQLQR